MIIELKNAEREKMPNFKGGDGVLDAKMFFDGTNRVIYGDLEPGSSIGYHKHEGNCEMVYILEGRAKILYDDGVEYCEAGDMHYCPEGHSHSVINDGDSTLRILGIVPKQ